jgi:hypothetical protein
MRDALVTYFHGEKLSGIAWGFAGVVSLSIAFGVIRFAGSYRAMIWPLIVFGLLQVGLGLSVGLRTDGRVARIEAALQKDSVKVRADEEKRIGLINTAFVALKIVWILMFVTGAIFIYLQRPTLFAVGLALVLEAAAMLALDSAAEARHHIYYATLTKP